MSQRALDLVENRIPVPGSTCTPLSTLDASLRITKSDMALLQDIVGYVEEVLRIQYLEGAG